MKARIFIATLAVLGLYVFTPSPARAQTPADAVPVNGGADREPRVCVLPHQPPYQGRSLWNANLWPGGMVPYEFDAGTTPGEQTAMRQAMDELEAAANVHFVPRTSQGDYLHIQNGNGNDSFVGMIGGGQAVNIYNWNYRFIMCHELMHALGVWHEQSRSDRDQYMTVNYGNIQAGWASQYDVQGGAAPQGDYDFDSVMHYGACDASTCCPPDSSCPCAPTCWTMTALPAYEQYQGLMGQRTHLSTGDMAGLVSRYGARTGPVLVSFEWRSSGGTTSDIRVACVDPDCPHEAGVTCNVEPGFVVFGTEMAPPTPPPSGRWVASTNCSATPCECCLGPCTAISCIANFQAQISAPQSNWPYFITWSFGGDVSTYDLAIGEADLCAVGHTYAEAAVGENFFTVFDLADCATHLNFYIQYRLYQSGMGGSVQTEFELVGPTGTVLSRSILLAVPGNIWDSVLENIVLPAGRYSLRVQTAAGQSQAGLETASCNGGNGNQYASTQVQMAFLPCSCQGLATQPQSVVACPGGNATFSVTTVGAGPFTYQWRRDGTALADEPDHTSGATAATLSIVNTTEADVGTYDCIVSSLCGSTTSNQATLTICFADFNCDGAVNSQDFFDFLNAFFASDPIADFNHDESINSQDFFDFLNAFFAGCP
jgi:hypothetical protein